ncbi:MAG: hypothetical protein WDW38_000840 [Sanguina aurantia]
MATEEDELDALEDHGGGEQSFVEEADEISAIIARVVSTDGQDAAAVYERYKCILYKYQEQSQLLDAILEDVVGPLSTLLRQQSVLSDDSSINTSPTTQTPAPSITTNSTPHTNPTATTLSQQQQQQQQQQQRLHRVLHICRLLNVLVIVRGYKTVVKFFPHEAADLEKVLGVLGRVKKLAGCVTDAEEGLAVWEAQGILLLWLSILILLPFELATLDSSVGAEESLASRTPAPYTQLVARLLTLCHEYLQHPGVAREMAALLLGRLLTRPDMRGALTEFLDWTEQALAAPETIHTPFLVPGILQATCFIFKLGQRQHLLQGAHRVWARLLQPLLQGPRLAGNALARKLAAKLTQRLGLTFLPPRLAPWRYSKDESSLDDTLAPDAATSAAGAAAAAAAVDREGVSAAAAAAAAASGGGGVEGGGDESEEDECELVEEVEEIVEGLLTGLRDKDTVVRWSAAKGVGRLTGCLPKELGDEVVESVMELFKPTESDTAWHGGCLALAELARRGLLLPDRLPAITPIVQKALCYDVRRGPHSIGSHVRDAAAYVCWAFARAYAPLVLQPSVDALAASLLVVACYDREVNCRRAAAAAFQEAVGRLGNFPHGMEILAVADYFTVGNINQAYLTVAPFVSAYPEYWLALASHLVCTQLRHWDKSLRELAARGLAALVASCSEYLSTTALDLLLPACLDPVLEVRHGAVLGVSELLPALKQAGVVLTPECNAQLCALVPAVDKARLYRGKGGENMREAISRFIEQAAVARLRFNAVQHGKVLEALDENLRHPHTAIQVSAVAALNQYSRWITHLAGLGKVLLVPAVETLLFIDLERGSLNRLPPVPCFAAAQVLLTLIDGVQQEEDVDQRDIASRVNCITALGQVCTTLFGAGGGTCTTHSEEERRARGVALMIEKVMPCLATALEDYTTDNRGDVGSWAREAAMQVLTTVVRLLTSRQPVAHHQSSLAGLVGASVGRLLQQAVERIARVREAAAGHLRTLATDPHTAAIIPGSATLRSALPAPEEGGDAAGSVSLDSIPRLAALLGTHPAYTTHLLEGLVASIGGVDNTLAKAASSALVDVLHTASIREASSHVRIRGTSPTPISTLPPTAVASARGGNAVPGMPDVGIRMPERSAAGPSSVPHVGGRAQGASCADVAEQFLCLWRRHARSARLATPLLRCADLLATKTDILHRSQLAPPPTASSSPPPSQHAPSPAADPATGAPSTSAVRYTLDPGPACAGEACGRDAPEPTPAAQTDAGVLSAAALGATDGPSLAKRTAAAAAAQPGTLLPPATAAICAAAAATAAETSRDSASREWFAHGLIQLTRGEIRMCTDVGRLLDAASLLCHLLPTGEPGRSSALQGLMLLLVSKFPKVRRHTAEQLYLQLLTLTPQEEELETGEVHAASDAAAGVDGKGAAGVGGVAAGAEAAAAVARGVCMTEAVLDAAADVLLCTTWDGDIVAAKVARDELAGMLRVQLPKMRAAAVAGGGKAAGQKDENSSYQSLIDDFARFR